MHPLLEKKSGIFYQEYVQRLWYGTAENLLLLTLTFYQQDWFNVVLSIFCILYHLIKGMCPKICGNWMLLIYFKIPTSLLEDYSLDYYEMCCVFNIPEPLAKKNPHNEFHNTSYGMKIHLWFVLSHELTRNEQISRWNRLFPQIGDGWHHNLIILLSHI